SATPLPSGHRVQQLYPSRRSARQTNINERTFNMGIYDGKTVVITGGSTGVGFATAKALVDEGASVLITGRTQSTLDSAGEQLGDAAITVRSDAASLADIDALADRVKHEFGGLNALFVNAGITRAVPFAEVAEQDYDELFNVNAK